MGYKCDTWIRTYCSGNQPLISPFSERVAGPDIVSYGLQPTGYDARLSRGIKIFHWAKAQGKHLDPLNLDPDFYLEREVEGDSYVIHPHGFILGKTFEYFRIPCNIDAVGMSKTTYSRVGLNLDIASINPGWQGHLQVHISNPTPNPIVLRVEMGFLHVKFQETDGVPERDYSRLANTRFQGEA